MHTHLLALGMLFFLIVLALEKLFTLTANRRLFAGFFWVYNAGLAVTDHRHDRPRGADGIRP